MTLSIKKLESFLSKNGMVPKIFFVTSKMTCIYIEVLIVKNLESFMLYIPSKYAMKIEYDTNVFLINDFPINDNGDLFDQYTSQIDITKSESNYNEVNLQTTTGKNHNIEKHFEDRYNRPISINNKLVNKEVFRQIRRLGLCLPPSYKLMLTMGNHMYCIKKENKIQLFMIGATNESSYKDKYRKMFLMVDINVLYDSVKNIHEDVTHLKVNLMLILRKNFVKHIDEVVTSNANRSILDQKRGDIITKEAEYIHRMKELEKILADLLTSERLLLEKKANVDEQLSMKQSINGVNKDIEKMKLTRQYEIKLAELNETKKEITVNILSLKIKHDNIILFADSLSFELIVMSESINSRITNIMDI